MESSASASPGADAAESDRGADLRRTVGRLYRRFRAERPEGELGDKALEILTWLLKSGPHTLTELSELDQVAPASMSETVNRLTAAGYATRRSDSADRRKVLIATTPEGARLASEARRQRNAWLDAQLSRLTPEQQDTVAKACKILTDIADAPVAPTGGSSDGRTRSGSGSPVGS